MKSSGIGGQAVLEGVMMRYKNDIAVAVRKPDGAIEVGRQKSRLPADISPVLGWPVIRGVASFISALVIGIRTLTFSASFFMEEEDEEENSSNRDESSNKDESPNKDKSSNKDKSPNKDKSSSKDKSSDGAMMFGTVALSLVLALAIFMVLPYAAANGILKLAGSDNTVLVAVIEGVLKLAIFIAYIALVSLMKDIKRTFMYHGAEHKCINCIESGHALTVENAMRASREHRRCGTSFIFFVLFISIVFFIALDVILTSLTSFDTTLFVNKLARMGMRLLLIPVIAGISFEFIQWAGNSQSAAANLLSRPGMLIQKLTTKEPEPSMVEVAIASVEAVFDWRSYLKEQGFPAAEENTSAPRDSAPGSEECVPEPEETAPDPGPEHGVPETKETAPKPGSEHGAPETKETAPGTETEKSERTKSACGA